MERAQHSCHIKHVPERVEDLQTLSRLIFKRRVPGSLG